MSDGSVRCWGLGSEGRLGLGNTASVGDDEVAGSVAAVDLGGRATAIAVGDAHTCALLDSGHVRCWGRGKEGQLGYGRPDNIGDDDTPATAGDVPLSEAVTAIAAGGNATCALLVSGAVRCWGHNEQDRLGYGGLRHGNLGDDEPVETWKPFRFKRRIIQLASNVASTCALFTDGAVQCWGEVLGSMDAPAKAAETADVDIGAQVATLSLMPTSGDGCVITSSQHARCWGADWAVGYASGQEVGVHSDMGKAPADVGDLPVSGTILGIAAGSEHGCALLKGGEVKCWGVRRLGLLGSPPGDSVPSKDAVVVELGAPAVALAVSRFHSCIITDRGGVRCWGFGKDGRLGYGSTENVGEQFPPKAAGDVLPTS
jgi:alpha-tubulin suppressor-like RCC1 family protein